MRNPEEIIIDEKTLGKILKDHASWYSDRGGERAYLSDANLSGAYLSDANLSWAKNILSIGPGGSREDMLYAVKNADCIMIKAGCFWGTIDEFRAAVTKTHGDNKHARYYEAACNLIEVYFMEEK